MTTLYEKRKPYQYLKHNSSDIQSIYFCLKPEKYTDNSCWTLEEADQWMRDHNYDPIKVSIEENSEGGAWIRYRIRDAEDFDRFITQIWTGDIHAVIGFY